jgi:hypothetical protein
MWPKNAAFVTALDERDEWEKVYEDKTAAVFTRKTSPT